MKTTIKLKDFISAIDYQIGEGYEYLWNCYGDYDVFGLDWGRDDLSASAVIIYNTKTQEVYELSVWDCLGETKPYRWVKPEYIKNHKKEAAERGFKFNIAIDRVKFIETTPAKILNHLKRLHKRKAKGT